MEPECSLLNLQEPATCPCPDPDQSNPCLPPPPNSTSWRFILILYSHVRLSLACGPFLFQVSPPKPCVHLSPISATCPLHPIVLDMITWTIFGEEYRSLSSSLFTFLHPLVTSSLLGPNILLSTLFSNTLSLRFSIIVGNHVLHPYETTGKLIFLCILILIFLDSKLEDNRFCTECYQTFPDFSLLLIFLLNGILIH